MIKNSSMMFRYGQMYKKKSNDSKRQQNNKQYDNINNINTNNNTNVSKNILSKKISGTNNSNFISNKIVKKVISSANFISIEALKTKNKINNSKQHTSLIQSPIVSKNSSRKIHDKNDCNLGAYYSERALKSHRNSFYKDNRIKNNDSLRNINQNTKGYQQNQNLPKPRRKQAPIQQQQNQCTSQQPLKKTFQHSSMKLVQHSSRKMSCLYWLLAIHKLFVEEYNKRKTIRIKYNTLLSYISHGLYEQDFSKWRKFVDSIPNQNNLSAQQFLKLVEDEVRLGNNKIIQQKVEEYSKIKLSFQDFFKILSKKNSILNKNNKIFINNKSENEIQKFKSNHNRSLKETNVDHQEIVQTARFQQNNTQYNNKLAQELNVKQNSNNHNNNKHMTTLATHNNIGQKNVSSHRQINTINTSQRDSITYNNSRQSLVPSLSPFRAQSLYSSKKSINNHKNTIEDSEIKSGLSVEQLTSPKQLMNSVMINSLKCLNMQNGNNLTNVSFSIQNDPQISFQKSIQSLQDILTNIKKTTYQDKAKSAIEIKNIIQQLIDYSLYKSKTNNINSQYFYACTIHKIESSSPQTAQLLRKIVQSLPIRQYFQSMEGVRITCCPEFIHEIIPILHFKIRILNLSNNNISNINILTQLFHSNNRIQFINLNLNKIRNISNILQNCHQIRQIHIQNNLIDHISIDNTLKSNKLQLLDLTYNKIEKQQDLSALRYIETLKIINLYGNPILHDIKWCGLIPSHLIYQDQTINMMSQYIQYKDITFNYGEYQSLNHFYKKKHQSHFVTYNEQKPQKITNIRTYFNNEMI